MLPRSFNEYGVLPQDYEVTLEEIRNSLLVLGPEPQKADWNQPWRRILLDNLEILVRQLWAAGVTNIHVNGSFVTDKGHPGDIDGCFECDYNEWHSEALQKKLNDAAPKKIWTWAKESRALVAGFDTPKLPMWRSYRVELYPYCPELPNGLWTADGEFRPFPEAFRFVKFGDRRKGILRLKQA